MYENAKSNNINVVNIKISIVGVVNTLCQIPALEDILITLPIILSSVIATSLALLMMFYSVPVYALSKDEVVYSKLDESGNTKYTVVTEHLTNDENKEEIIDYSDLENIENTNGSEEFTKDGNKLIWKANKNDIYYRGNTSKKMPVELKVTYKLDGKVMSVKDMLGKKGKVEITLKYTNNDKHGSMYTPFVVAMETNLDATTTKNLEVENGKVVSNGSKYIIAGIAAPGLYESLNSKELKKMDTIVISYDTTKFELSNIYSVVTAKILDSVDLNDLNELDTLYSKVGTLKASADKLANGSKSINDGAKKIREGVASAISKLQNNNETLDTNTINTIKETAKTSVKAKVESQKNEIMQKAAAAVVETENATHQIKTASDAGVDANTDLINALKLAATTKANQQCNQAYGVDCPAETILAAQNQAIETAKANMYQSALELAKQTAANTAYNTALQTAIDTSSEVSGSVAVNVATQVKNTVINKVVVSLNELVGGLDSLVEGTSTLATGMQQFDNQGISKISNFVNTDLKNGTNKIKQLQKLAKDYNTFTKIDKNTKGETKFILVIDGQKVKETKKTTKKTEKKETFTDRIKNLFK